MLFRLLAAEALAVLFFGCKSQTKAREARPEPLRWRLPLHNMRASKGGLAFSNHKAATELLTLCTILCHASPARYEPLKQPTQKTTMCSHSCAPLRWKNQLKAKAGFMKGPLKPEPRGICSKSSLAHVPCHQTGSQRDVETRGLSSCVIWKVLREE